MPYYKTSVTVPHTPDQMFELVSDIERYPDFIRWIRSMRVSGRRQDGAASHCVGEAAVGFRGFSERFATTVDADGDAKRVRANLVRGPFKRLENVWTFQPQSTGTRIEFEIDYEFSNLILRMLARNNFQLAVDKIMSAFINEADRRYSRTA